MTKQQQSRMNEAATEKGITPLQPMEWSKACELALAYHASFKKGGRPKEESELFKALVHIWMKEIHPTCTKFSAMDGASMKSLIEKMRLYTANPRNNLIIPVDKTLLEYNKDFFMAFCRKMPEFYRTQTLNVLASKFDVIMEEIRTKNGQKRVSQKPAEHLSDFAQR